MIGQDRVRFLLRYRTISCAHWNHGTVVPSTSRINHNARFYQTEAQSSRPTVASSHIQASNPQKCHILNNQLSSKLPKDGKLADDQSFKQESHTSRTPTKHRNHVRSEGSSNKSQINTHNKHRNYESRPVWPAIETDVTLVQVLETDKAVFHNKVVTLVRRESVAHALQYFHTNIGIAQASTWHAMMTGLLDSRRPKELKELWESWLKIIPPEKASDQLAQLKEDNMLPNADIFALLLRSKPVLVTPEQALQHLQDWGIPSNTYLHNTIIKDMIKQQDYTRAHLFLRDMEARKLEPDSFTVGLHLSLIKHRDKSHGPVHRSSRVGITCHLWDTCMRLKLDLTQPFLVSFMACFKDINDDTRTAQLVDYVVAADVEIKAQHIHYNILSVLMKKNRVDSMLKWYSHLRRINYPVDSLMFGIMITAFGRQRDLKSINMLYDEMVASGIRPNAKIFNVLLRTHAMLGDTQALNAVFVQMAELEIQADRSTFDEIQRGICEWYWDVFSVQNRSSSVKIRKDLRAEYGLSPRELFFRLELRSDDPIYKVQLQPLSSYLLPWMHLMNERGIEKCERIYNRTLLALRRDEDTHSMLYYLNEMVDCKIPHNDVALTAVMQQLRTSEVYHAHEKIAATQLFILCDKLISQDVRFEPQAWESLMQIAIKAENLVDARQCYTNMISAGCTPTSETYRSLMRLFVNSGNAGRDEQYYMQFVVSCYNDMLQSGVKMFVDHFDLCLSAHAVLGNTDAMKRVFSDMAEMSVTAKQSTMNVLEQARQHVAYTADMYNWIAQHQKSLSINQPDSNSSLSSVNFTPSSNLVVDVDPLALDTNIVHSFVLPSWSPLIDDSPVVNMQQPAQSQSLETSPRTENTSSNDEEMIVIKQELISLRGTWPGEPCMSTESPASSAPTDGSVPSVQSIDQSTNPSRNLNFAQAFRDHLHDAVEPIQMSPIDSLVTPVDENHNAQHPLPYLSADGELLSSTPTELFSERSYITRVQRRTTTGKMIGRPSHSFGARVPREIHYVHSRTRTQRLLSGSLIGRACESFGARFNIRYKPTSSVTVQPANQSTPLVAPPILHGRLTSLVRQHHGKPDKQPKQPRSLRSPTVIIQSLRPDVPGFDGNWLTRNKK